MIESLASNLAYDVLKSGAGKFMDALRGDPEQRALRQVYTTAFKDTIQQYYADSSGRVQSHVEKSLRDFVKHPKVYNLLLDLALMGERPAPEDLREEFLASGLDITTIGMIDTLTLVLTEELVDAAEDSNGALHNKVEINLLKQIIEMMKSLLNGKSAPRLCPSAPPLTRKFVGRTHEMTELRKQLASDQVVAISAVKAMGGMGKTTLAQAFCGQADLPFGAILWTDINEKPNPTDKLLKWGRYLDADYRLPTDLSLSDAADLLRDGLTDLVNMTCGGRALIILDDVWEDGIETVQLLRRAAPKGARVLLTTRFTTIVNHHDLQCRLAFTLDELPVDDAKALLTDLVNKVEVTQDHISRVVAILSGHPLALELAASSLNAALDTKDIEDTLESYKQGMSGGTRFDGMDLEDNQPNSLNVTFARTYDRLTPDLQTAFRALGVFVTDTPWNTSAAAALWNMTDEKSADEKLKALVQASLIELYIPEGKDKALYPGRWWRQHRLLRAYARALALRGVPTGTSELNDFQRRHFAHYETQHGDYNPDTAIDRFPFITPDFENIQNALAWGLENEPKRAVDFTNALDAYMMFNQAYTVRRELLEIAYQTAKDSEYVGGQANTQRALGELDRMEDAYPSARTRYSEALRLFEAIPDRLGQAHTLTSMGDMFVGLSQWSDAIPVYEQALTIARTIQVQLTVANILVDLGRARFEMGDEDGGIRDMREAAALFEAVHNPRWAQIARSRLNDMLKRAGQEEEAPQESTESEQEKALQMLAEVYQTQGAEALRERLKQAGLTDEVIEQLIALFSGGDEAE